MNLSLNHTTYIEHSEVVHGYHTTVQLFCYLYALILIWTKDAGTQSVPGTVCDVYCFINSIISYEQSDRGKY